MGQFVFVGATVVKSILGIMASVHASAVHWLTTDNWGKGDLSGPNLKIADELVGRFP